MQTSHFKRECGHSPSAVCRIVSASLKNARQADSASPHHLISGLSQSTSLSKWIPRGLRFHGTPAHWLICQGESQDFSPNAPSLHARWTISKLLLKSIASWKFSISSSQLPCRQRGSKFSNADFPFGKNNNSSTHVTARPACGTRRARRQCASHWRVPFGTIPLKSEHLELVCLELTAASKTASLRPFSGCVPLNVLRQFCALWSCSH